MGCTRSKNIYKEQSPGSTVSDNTNTSVVFSGMSELLEQIGISDRLSELENLLKNKAFGKTTSDKIYTYNTLSHLGLKINRVKFDVIEVGKLVVFAHFCVKRFENDGYIICSKDMTRLFNALLVVLDDITTEKEGPHIDKLQKTIQHLIGN